MSNQRTKKVKVNSRQSELQIFIISWQHLLFHVSVKLLTYSAKLRKLECGPMPNLTVALPNIGGALCSTPQSLADAHY